MYLKIELKNKYCIENINFSTFKIMNTQFLRLNLYLSGHYYKQKLIF